MKILIKHLLREDMQTHLEMQKLADDVFMASIRYFCDKTVNLKNALNVVDRIQDMFTKINVNKYTNLNNFLNEYVVGLKYKTNLYALGDFIGHSETDGDIVVRYSLQKLKDNIEKVVFPILKSGQPINQQMFSEICKKVYDSTYDENTQSTLTHELQHAYDSWRSEGMFMASKRGRDYDAKYGGQPEGTPISQKQRDEYDKLEYEINARFSQAIRAIKFYEKDEQSKNIILKPFDDIKTQFEQKFGSYEKMTPNFVKRLMKRLSKAYYQMSDIITNYNKKLSSGEINEDTPLITENAVGRHLIVVDVQPEYASWMNGMQNDLFEYINTHIQELSDLTFLYNGEDTLGMVSEYDYREWLVENGLDEDIAYEARLYDKGYAFFRNCMDNNGDEQGLINLVKFMRDNNINDSRELDQDFWESFVDQYGNEDIKELMEGSDDSINIPDLMDFLDSFNNIVLVGGGIDQCLKEVEIAMDALEKNYDTWYDFTY